VTTYLRTAPPRDESPQRAGGGRALHPYALAVVAVAAVQGILVGAMAVAGYFYLDDVDMSAEAAKHPFGWAYLTLALNDHLTPGLRAVYWISAHFAPYDNGVTVLGRVLLQAAATLLMGYLLGQLVGPGRAALLGLGFYAFSPLLVPSLLSFSSGVNLLPTHVGVLLLLVMHVRYEATRRPRYAVFGALGILFALLFWEKAVLSVALAPMLTFLYLSSGGLRARFRAVGRSWPAWLAYATPVVAFFVCFLLGPYGSHASTPHPGDVWNIAWDAWLHSIGPSLVGGPWTWFTTKLVYFGVSSPGSVATTCGQVTATVLTVLAIRRNGLLAVRAWLLPLFVLLGSAVLLASGRYEYVGVILARNFHYLSEVSIPLVLAVVLMLVRLDPDAVAKRGGGGLWPNGDGPDGKPPDGKPPDGKGPDGKGPGDKGPGDKGPGGGRPADEVAAHDGPGGERGADEGAGTPAARPTPSRTTAARPIGIGLVLVIAAYALSYGTTVGAFERRWVESPIRGYLTTGTSDLKLDTAKGPVAIYDTDVPGAVATLLQTNRRASEVFGPVEPGLPAAVRWDDAGRQLYVFDEGGHLLKARFVEEASSADQPGVFCAHPLRGVGSVTVTLSRRLTRPDEFVQLNYLAEGPTRVNIRLADGNTQFAPRRNGSPTLTAGRYGTVLLGTPDRAFDRLVITSNQPAAVLCVSAKAGHPEPAI
jgi:hypothetical protein